MRRLIRILLPLVVLALVVLISGCLVPPVAHEHFLGYTATKRQ